MFEYLAGLVVALIFAAGWVLFRSGKDLPTAKEWASKLIMMAVFTAIISLASREIYTIFPRDAAIYLDIALGIAFLSIPTSFLLGRRHPFLAFGIIIICFCYITMMIGNAFIRLP